MDGQQHRQPMHVIKRDGSRQPVDFNQVLERCRDLVSMKPALTHIDPAEFAQCVVAQLHNDITTVVLDRLAAEHAAYQSTEHLEYETLASRYVVSDLHKRTPACFSDAVFKMRHYVHPKKKEPAPLVSDTLYRFVELFKHELNAVIRHEADYHYSFFAMRTFDRRYLISEVLDEHQKNEVEEGKRQATVFERPQYMLMRVAIGGIECEIKRIFDGADAGSNAELRRAFEPWFRHVVEAYESQSELKFTHASPTLFNAGTMCPQLSSCFLLQMKEDSIDGIYDTLKRCALISKTGGGIGVSATKIRAANSYIRGTNGKSDGLVPMLRVFNDTARYVNQGGKRKGAFAMYLEPWHADVFAFLDMGKKHGKKELRGHDLHYALWMNDLFMERCDDNASNPNWSLFCPDEAPGLVESHSDAFRELYERYEREGRARRVIPARKLLKAIFAALSDYGEPYILFKDVANRKSNQQHLGTIQCSNLCTEIIEYTAPDEVAVCNLASISLPAFFDCESKTFDLEAFYRTVRLVARRLDMLIDSNHYPVEEARRSNMRHRPIGIGIQGLADLFAMARVAHTSEPARAMNVAIFEVLYYAALVESMERAQIHGAFPTFKGSPTSRGLLQMDLWQQQAFSCRDSHRYQKHFDHYLRGQEALHLFNNPLESGETWQALRNAVKQHGVRNSLLVAPMPTASTSQMLGNQASFEPFEEPALNRRTIAGEFVQINRHLMKDMMDRGLYTQAFRDELDFNRNVSVQPLKTVPDDLKAIYKTVWETPQQDLVDMALERGLYIDQSQSFNVFWTNISYAKFTALLYRVWQNGNGGKTCVYYLKTQKMVDSLDLTKSSKAAVTAAVDNEFSDSSDSDDVLVCRMDDDCVMCGA